MIWSRFLAPRLTPSPPAASSSSSSASAPSTRRSGREALLGTRSGTVSAAREGDVIEPWLDRAGLAPSSGAAPLPSLFAAEAGVPALRGSAVRVARRRPTCAPDGRPAGSSTRASSRGATDCLDEVEARRSSGLGARASATSAPWVAGVSATEVVSTGATTIATSVVGGGAGAGSGSGAGGDAPTGGSGVGAGVGGAGAGGASGAGGGVGAARGGSSDSGST
jgi:hypothetical protein